MYILKFKILWKTFYQFLKSLLLIITNTLLVKRHYTSVSYKKDFILKFVYTYPIMNNLYVFQIC